MNETIAPKRHEPPRHSSEVQWEYLVETEVKNHLMGVQYDNDALMKDLNKRGKMGWELVMCMGGAMSQTQHMMQFVWKRPSAQIILQ